jgi:SAM-dependent methyltransferase
MLWRGSRLSHSRGHLGAGWTSRKVTAVIEQPQSPSMKHPDYWWYRARSRMLHTIVGPALGSPDRVLDVGSADGPSVAWMQGRGRRVAVDLDMAALKTGDVCASALALPFADSVFDVITAFDVLEHCEPEARAMAEFARVMRPGGRLLLAVPAYQWAWSDFDRDIGHYRRYTRSSLTAAVLEAGLVVDRVTYMFAGTLPFFAAERLSRRFRGLEGRHTIEPPHVSPLQEKLFMALCAADNRYLSRGNLPFGSSVVAVATKPARASAQGAGVT